MVRSLNVPAGKSVASYGAWVVNLKPIRTLGTPGQGPGTGAGHVDHLVRVGIDNVAGLTGIDGLPTFTRS
ncbi:MAG: hypothetical protein R2722_10215 [Tessaracoccus sp.]